MLNCLKNLNVCEECNESNQINESNESNNSNQSNESNNSNQSNESNGINNSIKIDKEYRYNKKYIEIAQKISELSYAERKKVGCIIVKNTVIISDGFNGTPTGYENNCEDTNGITKWYTLHAEANAITKLVRIGGISAIGATLYLTLSPCKDCAKLILQCGINKVIYLEEYHDKTGINFLKKSGIICLSIN